jgi:hypothetical protein
MSRWDEMIKEILLDISKIVAADLSVRYMVAVVQWRGKIIGRPIYQPTPAELNDDRAGFLHGMSMIPEPQSDWKAVALEFVPKANGGPSKDDMPIAYYLISEKGNGVAFPARFNGGQVTWTHSEEIIDHVGDRLLAAGLLEMAKKEAE